MPVYLDQFETFVLEHDVRAIDPRIARWLIGLHSANGWLGRAERVIQHIDPACLDIDQVPLVQMIGLIRKVMQLCCYPVRDATAPLIVNEYRMYIRTRQTF